MSRQGPRSRARHSLGARSGRARVQQQPIARDRASNCVVTGFLGMLGDLGHDIDFLYRDKTLLGLVSRSGVDKVERPCVAIQQVFHDWVSQQKIPGLEVSHVAT